MAGRAQETDTERSIEYEEHEQFKGLFQKADLSVAEKHRADQMIKAEGVWKTTVHDLGDCGVGVELYFMFLKDMALLFFVISLISLYMLYSNIDGENLKDRVDYSIQSLTTLANQYGIDLNERDLDDAEDKTDKIESNKMAYAICDIISVSLFLIFIIFYRCRSLIILIKNHNRNLTLKDFAIAIKGIPPSNDITQQDLQRHFGKFATVHEAAMTKVYNGRLRQEKVRSEMVIKLIIAEQMAKSRGIKDSSKVRTMELQLHDYDDRHRIANDAYHFEELENNEIAYVVFTKISDRNQVIQMYKAETCCGLTASQPESYALNKQFPLLISEPEDPSNIHWENLEITPCERLFRKLIVFICIIIVLAISIACAYFFRTLEEEIPNLEKCQDLGVDGDLSVSAANTAYNNDDDLKNCWCKLQPFDDVLTDSDVSEFCDDYYETIAEMLAGRFGISIGILTLNVIIREILRALTSWERIDDVTAEELRFMSRAFFAEFLNTAVVILIVNLDASGTLPVVGDVALNGDFSDFTRDWYIKVGATITTTMFLSIFFPALKELLMYPLGKLKRKLLGEKQETQFELNKLYDPPKFIMSEYTSEIMIVLFTCFLYSGGIPILNVICFAAFFMHYWVFKYLMLNHYKRPPRYTHLFNSRVIRLLPYAVILHCAFSLCALGSEAIFPKDFETATNDANTEYVKAEEITGEERFTSVYGIIYIILILVALFIKIVDYFSAQCCNPRNMVAVNPDSVVDHLEKVLPKFKADGNYSYQITANGNYKHLIGAMTKQELNNRTTKSFKSQNSSALATNKSVHKPDPSREVLVENLDVSLENATSAGKRPR